VLEYEMKGWGRFNNRRQVASYTGLCPGIHQSDGRLGLDKLGFIEAQYEVLGNDAKRPVRPARDDRNVSAFGLARRSATPSIGRSSCSSFVPPSLRCGAAFSLRARRSSKSEGGILTMADRPGRIPL
jgi:hypothetical protein